MARKGRVTPMSKTQQVGARKISKKTKINDTEITESIEKNTFLNFNITGFLPQTLSYFFPLLVNYNNLFKALGPEPLADNFSIDNFFSKIKILNP